MNKFKNVKLANLLTQKQKELNRTVRKAFGRNEARWTSTFEMLKRFKIIQYEMNLVIADNQQLFQDENGNQIDLVTPYETVRLNKLSEDLEIIHQTTVIIQKSSFHNVGVKNALRLLKIVELHRYLIDAALTPPPRDESHLHEASPRRSHPSKPSYHFLLSSIHLYSSFHLTGMYR